MKTITLNLMLFAAIALTSCGGTKEQIEEVPETLEEVVLKEETIEPAYDGKTFILVAAEVEDFSKWEAVYLEKSDSAARIGYSTNVENEAMVGVVEFTKSHDVARTKFASERMRASMAEAGVRSAPKKVFLNTVWMNEEKVPGAYHVGITHEVVDFDKWKVAFDADRGNRIKGGLNDLCVATAEGNDNMVTIILSTDNIEVCKSMFADPKVAEVMQDAGVIGTPKTSYWKVMSH